MRILVVDDEPAILQLIDRYLTRQGHNVLVAASACEANALVLDSWQPFDAAVLDIGLPGIGGVALGELLRGLFPRIRLVLISGSTNVPTYRLADAPRLVTPFNMTDLITKLDHHQSDGVPVGPTRVLPQVSPSGRATSPTTVASSRRVVT